MTIDISQELHFLEELGPRLTGSPAHKALIERVAGKLTALGLEVQHDRHEFTRWDVPFDREHLSLTIAGADIEISSAYPYSGTTGENGLTGQLKLRSGLARRSWKAARGAIAVLEVPHIAVPRDLIVGQWDRDGPQSPVSHPVFSAGLFGPKLQKARKAGVKAVVLVWRGLTVGNASKQYVPFIEPYKDLPAVWVAGAAGERVLAAARAGAEATLVLNAELTPGCESETIWTKSEGEVSDETVLVATHTDGTNVLQENGFIALLELAQAAVSRSHQRNIVFVFATGHLRLPAVSEHGQAMSGWLKAHPELWKGRKRNAKAVGGLVLEHLGAVEYAEDLSDGSYGPTGKPEPETVYATTRKLRSVVKREWRAGNNLTPTPIVKPGPLMYFGEGEPLFQNGIPAVSLVTGPQYLMAEMPGQLVDIDMMRQQIDSCVRLLWCFDRMTRFGSLARPSRWQKAVAAIRILIIRLRTLFF